jgi:hypothetical protein
MERKKRLFGLTLVALSLAFSLSEVRNVAAASCNQPPTQCWTNYACTIAGIPELHPYVLPIFAEQM